jgi:hypothetical protein
LHSAKKNAKITENCEIVYKKHKVKYHAGGNT